MTKRTTVTFDEEVLSAVRRKAAEDSRTVSDVVNETLRVELLPRTSPGRYRLKLKPFDFGGRWIDLRDRRAVYETLVDRDRRKYGR